MHFSTRNAQTIIRRDNSMDELALIDMPAQANFALKTSGQPTLAFFGHSQVGADWETLGC